MAMSILVTLMLAAFVAFMFWGAVLYYMRYGSFSFLLDWLGEKLVILLWLESIIILFPIKALTKSAYRSEGSGGFLPLPFELSGFAAAFALN